MVNNDNAAIQFNSKKKQESLINFYVAIIRRIKGDSYGDKMLIQEASVVLCPSLYLLDS